MKMKLNKKWTMKKSKDAVTDLVGQLLVLAVIVILFSGIFTYVITLPPPKDTTYTDFKSNLWYPGNDLDSDYVVVNVTNTGGQDLYDHNTMIYIITNETDSTTQRTNIFHISDSENSIGNIWGVGGIWTRTLNDGPYSTIRMVVVSNETNMIIFDQFLTGIPNSAPIIGDRGTDPEVGIITETATFYVYVFDSNNDLDTVQLDMSQIPKSPVNTINLKRGSGDKWISLPETVLPSWNGGLVTIKATDQAGHFVTAKMTLKAAYPEEGNDTGYEPPNIIYSGNSGFNTFNNNDWTNHNFDAKPQYVFNRSSEDIAVVAVSKTLLNTDSRNYLEVVNITTKAVVYSSNAAFERYKFTSGFYCYQATIDLSLSGFADNERYMLNIYLEDNSAVPDKVIASHEISIWSGGSYPTMSTYVNRTDVDVETSFWNNDIIEVKITSSSFPSNSDWYGAAGDVSIRDFSGGTQLHWAPAVPSTATNYYWNGGPVSNVVKFNATTYAFAINLTAAKTGDPWIEGKGQAYVLDYDMFTLKDASNKYYNYQLSTIVNISSPTFSAGLAVGFVEGISPQNGGGGTYYEGNVDWVMSSSMQYYINDNSWTPPVPIDQDFWNHHRPQTLLSASGDVDGDGTVSEVVSFYASATPHQTVTNNQFGNSAYADSEARINLNTYDGTKWAVTKLRATGDIEVKSLILANIDQDDDLDVIYGLRNGAIIIGRNNGDDAASWTWTQFYIGADSSSTSRSVVALAAANLDTDAIMANNTRGCSIVVGCNDGSVYVLRNTNGFGNWYTTQAARSASNQEKMLLDGLSGMRVSSLGLGDLNGDSSWDLALIRTSSGAGKLLISYNSDLYSLSPTTSLAPIDLGYGGKTNLTIGKFLGNDKYPDIAIMVEFKGIYFINNTWSGSANVYTKESNYMPYAIFDTKSAAPNKAALSCMVTGDIDGDGFNDLVVGTMLNSDALGYAAQRISKGAVFVLVNGDQRPSGFQPYLVDNPGTPIRCVAIA